MPESIMLEKRIGSGQSTLLKKIKHTYIIQIINVIIFGQRMEQLGKD